MKSQFGRIIRIRLYKIIIAVLSVATVVCAGAYFKTTSQKFEPLWAGLFTGLIVAVVQYLLDWNEHSEVEYIKKLGIQRILPYRDDRNHYQQLLASAQREIW